MTHGPRRPVEAWRVSTRWKASCKFAKKRAGYRCEVCGASEMFHLSAKGRRMSNLVAGHRVPPERYAGSPTDVGNLWILCTQCNASQGNRTPEEWRAARSGRLVDLGLVEETERTGPGRNPFAGPRSTFNRPRIF